MIKQNVIVESPAINNPRKGRGFSKDELAEAKISVYEAKKAGLILDVRRKSKYPENVETLKLYMKKHEEGIKAKEELRLKAKKENEVARKEAEKRKGLEDEKKSERQKALEEDKKKIQEEIARKEAEAIEAAKAEVTPKEPITEVVKEGEVIPEVTEPTPEQQLEKVEADLAEATNEKAELETIAIDGTKRVIKRIRKKPSTSTKSVIDKAGKKD